MTDEKICPICSETSEQPHQVHYGGLACFSCKAFWRRAHQKTRNPTFKCKKGGACVINLKTRRKCQKCRYNQCLANGMRPEAVLSDDQKKARFKNAIKKRESGESAKEPVSKEFIDTSSSDSSDNENDEDQNLLSSIVVNHDSIGSSPTSSTGSSDKVIIIKMPDQSEDSGLESGPSPCGQFDVSVCFEPEAKKVKIESITQITSFSCEDYDVTTCSEPLSKRMKVTEQSCNSKEVMDIDETDKEPPYSFSMKNAGPPGSQVGKRQVELIMATYQKTCLQMDIDNDFKECLIAFHQHRGSMTRDLLQGHVLVLGQQFKQFAFLHKEFHMLTPSDQKRLLARNTPLFIQYILSRYFMAPDGYSQLYWLLGLQTPEFPDHAKTSLNKVTLNMFNKLVRLFKSEAVIDQYKEFCKRLNVDHIRFPCNAVVGHLVLFAHDQGMSLDEPDLVADLHEDALAMCPHSVLYNQCTERPHVPGMLYTLEAMARSFAQNMIWNNQNNNSSDQQCRALSAVSTKFSLDEEHWLQGQFELLQTCYESVSLGEDQMKEFAMYSLDVPLSKGFMPHAVAVFSERFTRVMDQHPEVASLSESKRSLLYKRNMLDGVALNVCKLETCRSGEEQLMFACGRLDDQLWKKDFQNFFNTTRKLKKLTLHDSNKKTRVLPDGLMANFDRLNRNIGSLIKDPEMYKLLTLVLLFSDVDDSTMPGVARLRDQYLSILRRRRSWLMLTNDNEEEDEERRIAFGNVQYSRFNSCLCDVKELAMIIQKIK